MSGPGGWSPVLTADGSWTLAHPLHGETCHSRSGAWLEACERYARPCGLFEWTRSRGAAPLRLLDVGTGLGLNLAAALHAVEAGGGVVEAIGLERDRAVIEAGLELAASHGVGEEPWERWHGPVRVALERALEANVDEVRVPLGARSSLLLLVGDARATIEAVPLLPGCDAVFLDPFSPAREPELWDPGFLACIARRMAPGSRLSTYTAAFQVRLGLARAGLRIGRGPRVGAKAEGTLAAPDGELPPLGRRVQERLRRVLTGTEGILPHRLREGAPEID